jgi:hypothetical protein
VAGAVSSFSPPWSATLSSSATANFGSLGRNRPARSTAPPTGSAGTARSHSPALPTRSISPAAATMWLISSSPSTVP